jgi:indole-3-glycerol phosphate synthase
MAALVEVHTVDELETAMTCDPALVGINNRDLHTFKVDLATSERIIPTLPAGVKGVAESGVRSGADAARLRAAGAVNLLVGEALVRAADPGALLRALVAAGDPPARDGVESPPSGPGGRG